MASKRGSGFAIVLVALTTFAFIVLPSCAPVEQHVTASRAAGTEIFSSVGDVMLRVEVQEDLPNIFGRADIYGRKRDRGFSDIRYMGLTADGLAIFRRRDVDILTNEDTMNRMGFGTATVTAQPAGQGVIATGITTRAPAPNLAVLPPDTTEFTLDLAKARLITLREKSIEILDAKPSGIRFVVQQQPVSRRAAGKKEAPRFVGAAEP